MNIKKPAATTATATTATGSTADHYNDYLAYTAAVKQGIQGRWLDVLPNLAPSLAQAVAKAPRHVGCPMHGGKDGFRFFKDSPDTGGAICNRCGAFSDGFGLLMEIYSWPFNDAVAAVGEAIGITPEHLKARISPKPVVVTRSTAKQLENQQQQAKRTQRINDVWQQAEQEHDGKRLAAYLAARGLAALPNVPDTLKCHPCLPYWHDHESGFIKLGNFAAMVAPVTGSNGRMVSLHRTYLSPKHDGKADVPSAKKMMAAIKQGGTNGGAIRLHPAAATLAVAEGIETALAVHLATQHPVWATMNAGGMARLWFPPMVRTLLIYADNDESGTGLAAAKTLAKKASAAGIETAIYLPSCPGDWLDVLNSKEATA